MIVVAGLALWLGTSSPPCLAPVSAATTPRAAGLEEAEPADKELARAIDAWLELLAFVSREPLSAEQKQELRSHLAVLIRSRQSKYYRSVLEFWPPIKERIGANTGQQENFRYLLSALIRAQRRREARASRQDGVSLDPGYSLFLAQIVGPARVAAAGNPPLTEDAIDAYAEMASFLFELKNPGQTVDGADNRVIFASAVKERFKDAPTPKDREAMANFDIAWARFKVVWKAADESARQKLSQGWLSGDGLKRSLQSGDAKLDSLLDALVRLGPWNATHDLGTHKTDQDPSQLPPGTRPQQDG